MTGLVAHTRASLQRLRRAYEFAFFHVCDRPPAIMQACLSPSCQTQTRSSPTPSAMGIRPQTRALASRPRPGLALGRRFLGGSTDYSHAVGRGSTGPVQQERAQHAQPIAAASSTATAQQGPHSAVLAGGATTKFAYGGKVVGVKTCKPIGECWNMGLVVELDGARNKAQMQMTVWGMTASRVNKGDLVSWQSHTPRQHREYGESWIVPSDEVIHVRSHLAQPSQLGCRTGLLGHFTRAAHHIVKALPACTCLPDREYECCACQAEH